MASSRVTFSFYTIILRDYGVFVLIIRVVFFTRSKRSGTVMAEAVSLRPYTAQAQVHYQAGVFEICVGQSDSGTHFDLSSSVSSSQCNSNTESYILWLLPAPLSDKLLKTKRTVLCSP